MLPHCRRLILQSWLLFAAIVLVAMVGVIFNRGAWVAVSIAAALVVCALLPPLWFDIWLGRSVAAPVATVAWRLGVLLPAVLLSASQAEPTRKYFQYSLLACYFIALPLESWLLTRQSRL